MASGTIGVANH